jgi:hypothetical protein
MKKVFSFHWRSVFVQFFCEFVEVILIAHARWAVKRNGHVCNKYRTLIHLPTIIGLAEHALCKINNRRRFEIILPPCEF